MEYVLFDGKIVLSFDEEKHVYRVDGRVLPGVTTICGVLSKPALVPWAAKMCAEYLDANLKPGQALDEVQKATLIKAMKGSWKQKKEEAADIGTIAHKFAEDYLQGREPAKPVNELARAAVDAFLEWMAAHHVKIISSERRILSLNHWYAGTVDLIAEVDGETWVADFKTSSGIWPEYGLQLAGYRIALREEMGQSLKRLVLWFPKDGKPFEARALENDDADERGFLAALELHNWRKAA